MFNIYKCYSCSIEDCSIIDLLEANGKIFAICIHCKNRSSGKQKVNFYPELSEDKKVNYDPPDYSSDEHDDG